jgi:hypothetical protein
MNISRSKFKFAVYQRRREATGEGNRRSGALCGGAACVVVYFANETKRYPTLPRDETARRGWGTRVLPFRSGCDAKQIPFGDDDKGKGIASDRPIRAR